MTTAQTVASTPAVGSPGAAASKSVAEAPQPSGVAGELPAPKSAPDASEVLKKAESERKAAALEKRQFLGAQKKWQEEKLSLGAKLSKLGELEKAQANAKLDPASFLKSIYGDSWYDVVVEAKVNGVPPANLIAAEVQKIRDDFDGKLAAKDEEFKKQQQAASQQGVEQARRQLVAEASDFWKASAADFPALDAYGSESAIAGAIAQAIEGEYNRTEVRGENGELVRHGRVLSLKEAAESIEAQIVGLAEKVAGGAKYQEKLRAKLAPAPTQSPAPGRTQSPAAQRTEPNRKTLSNDLTGSTPSRAPSLTDEQRRERAIAAFHAVRSKAVS